MKPEIQKYIEARADEIHKLYVNEGLSEAETTYRAVVMIACLEHTIESMEGLPYCADVFTRANINLVEFLREKNGG